MLLLSWEVDDTPSASADETAVRVHDLCGDDWDVVGVSVVLGYRQRLDVDHILRGALEQEPERLSSWDPDRALFVVSRLQLSPSGHSSWARWRRGLFLAMNRVARDQPTSCRSPGTGRS